MTSQLQLGVDPILPSKDLQIQAAEFPQELLLCPGLTLVMPSRAQGTGRFGALALLFTGGSAKAPCGAYKFPWFLWLRGCEQQRGRALLAPTETLLG